MKLSNIFKSWRTSLIGLFSLLISGAYVLFNDSAEWKITTIFLAVGIVLLLSPDKAKNTINKAIDKADKEIDKYNLK